MEKAINYPTDGKLLESARQHLVRLAVKLGIRLRQNYNREAPRMAAQVARYVHAKQYRRMRGALKGLRTLVGRVQRKLLTEEVNHSLTQSILQRVTKLLAQQRTDKNKLYSMYAPESDDSENRVNLNKHGCSGVTN